MQHKSTSIDPQPLNRIHGPAPQTTREYVLLSLFRSSTTCNGIILAFKQSHISIYPLVHRPLMNQRCAKDGAFISSARKSLP
ncbi:hypothetical protein VN97_g2600 [Penicillium thymicola]|uniref:Uncharacterized protein n=1 Tax=Penicillium thymicola TaxID=293382 RepID=A0AAI9XBM0_PENTH|nr:hypothetical protein VN97_g2600 [Penicillium thymicola]